MTVKFAHTNIVARDWKRLARFYERVFGCVPVPPERDLHGDWLDRATSLHAAHIRGIHLRLPGHGDSGPTLEIFQYATMPEHPVVNANTPGFSHIAFAVEDVEVMARAVIDHGGSAVGERVEREISGAGLLVFQYVADPEGNTVEIQSWS
jgi:predicted enzyme related to lactoylglutathione lyase